MVASSLLTHRLFHSRSGNTLQKTLHSLAFSAHQHAPYFSRQNGCASFSSVSGDACPRGIGRLHPWIRSFVANSAPLGVFSRLYPFLWTNDWFVEA